MTTAVHGPRKWSAKRSSDGHREYTLETIVSSGIADGPAAVMATTGLTLPGAPWQIAWGQNGVDVDLWATCQADMDVKPFEVKDGEKARYWSVTQIFSTRSTPGCLEDVIEDPLLAPQRISGGFIRYNEEATLDRFGNVIVNSAWEQIRGPQVEFEMSRATITIEQTVADLELDLLSELANTVNDAPLWGVPARCIKFTPGPWEKRYYGSCSVFFTRTLEFEVFTKVDDAGELISGFDRALMDEGTKVLYGHWDMDSASATYGEWVLDPIDLSTPEGDPNNPNHFIRFKDRNGENARVVLDGAGKPYNPDDVEPTEWWCINDGNVPTCFEGTCTAAKEFAESIGGTRYGPYASESACDLACESADERASYFCPETSGAGIVYVERYDQADFLQLGIPTDLLGP